MTKSMPQIQRDNISRACKGRVPWNKKITGYTTSKRGQPVTQATRDKISKANKGRPPNSGSFKKGHVPWTKGKPLPEKTKRKISAATTKQLSNPTDHPLWNGGHSRNYIYKEAKALTPQLVAEQPFCSVCEENKEGLFLHHIDENPRNNNRKNLMVVCRTCHTSIHHKGKSNKKKAART